MKTSTHIRGRVSCWVLGGIGCLGILIVVLVLVWFAVNRFGQALQGAIQSVMVLEQEVEPHFKTIAGAIRSYYQDTGKFPASLSALSPKYLSAEAIKPITLKDGTSLKWVYRAPKPNDPNDAIVLQHSPPVKSELQIAGQTVQVEFTLQMTKNFQAFVHQETIGPDGTRQMQKRSLR